MAFIKKYLFGFLLIVMAAILFVSVKFNTAALTRIKVQELEEGFLRTSSVIHNKAELYWFDEGISFWNPTKSDYDFALNIAQREIKLQQNPNWHLLNHNSLDRYYKQFAFIISENHDSIILINAFCEIPEKPTDSAGSFVMSRFDWKNKLLLVEDGGDCYWKIIIHKNDLSRTRLQVNG